MQATQFNKWVAVTPSDSLDLADFKTGNRLTDELHIGGAGTLTAVMQDGGTAQFTVIAGQRLPIQCRRVNATGTAATLIMAMYKI